MRKSLLCIFIVIATLFLVSNADAFNGKRKGFIIGGGLGAGFSTFKETVTIHDFFGSGTEVLESERENKFALATNFKIGYAPSNLLEIFFTVKDSWFSTKVYFLDESSGEDVIMASGFWGPGVTYYFNPEAPSYFITGGFGVSTLSLPFESHSEIKFGPGVYAGAGYEFRDHFYVELDLGYGKPKSLALFGIGESTSMLSVALTINALAY
jgi:hypothetical protein